MRINTLQILFIVGSLLVVPSLSAQVGTIAEGQIILEAPAKNMQSLEDCDILHQVRTCDNWHFTPKAASTGATLDTGRTLYFNDQPYVLEWFGPAYHLSSGVILEPVGTATASLKGQQWIEVYPQHGRIHTSSSWSDMDQNGALSRADTIELDSGTFGVQDIRLHLRVRPASH